MLAIKLVARRVFEAPGLNPGYPQASTGLTICQLRQTPVVSNDRVPRSAVTICAPSFQGAMGATRQRNPTQWRWPIDCSNASPISQRVRARAGSRTASRNEKARVGIVPLNNHLILWLPSHPRSVHHPQSGQSRGGGQSMSKAATTLLASITAYCGQTGVAESTFGRHAVNDGKFVSRLRDGARITPATLVRVNDYLTEHGYPAVTPDEREIIEYIEVNRAPALTTAVAEDGSRERNFRFFDNRQKYLLFVNTCSEKAVVARRVGLELAHLHPRPPSLRLFDAGMGDGTILASVMREMHRRFPTMPFYVVGKEISLEDVRLSLQRMADRLFEHPATALIVTNMHYTEAPWLEPRATSPVTPTTWQEVALTGTTAHEFAQQIDELEPFLSKAWQVRPSPKTGNPIYEHPAVLVIYRKDYQFLLDDVIPQPGNTRADFDLVIASQPYRARVPTAFKAERVIAPLVRALQAGGRLIGIHSRGQDPGLEIVQRVWPGEMPFATSRQELLSAVRRHLGDEARAYKFNAYADARAIFRYDMHTLPTEISASIGTSTLFAAWNAATYVAQIEDERLAEVVTDRSYLDATSEVLREHGSLWFLDESYIISRKRGTADTDS